MSRKFVAAKIVATKNQLIAKGVPKLMEEGNKRKLIKIAKSLDFSLLLQRYVRVCCFDPIEELYMYNSDDIKAMSFYTYWCPCCENGFYQLHEFIRLISRKTDGGLGLAGKWGENLADAIAGGYILSYKGCQKQNGRTFNGLTFDEFLHPETIKH